MSTVKEYLELTKRQLALEVEGIKLSIQHNLTKGTEAEHLVVDRIFKKFLPKRYSFGSGFIAHGESLTPQLDIIIHDELLNSPVYQGAGSSVFLAGSVYGAVEVTIQKLDSRKLEKDLDKLSKVRTIIPDEKMAFWDITSRLADHGLGNIVHKEPVFSAPPPRSYMIALCGTEFASIEVLAAKLEELTRSKHTHLHGLLVLNPTGNDWLLGNKAYANAAVQYTETDSLYMFLEHMKTAFLGMQVGRLPARPV